MARKPRRWPSSEGLREYVLVTLFLALAVAGALILFGDEIRGTLGLGPAAPPPPPPASS
jgi:hypothetical protein